MAVRVVKDQLVWARWAPETRETPIPRLTMIFSARDTRRTGESGLARNESNQLVPNWEQNDPALRCLYGVVPLAASFAQTPDPPSDERRSGDNRDRQPCVIVHHVAEESDDLRAEANHQQ